MNFNGKTIVVTGGALGIGKATCELLSERGASVAILDMNRAEGEQTLKEITENGAKAAFYQVDVSNKEQLEEAIVAARTDLSEICGLIVCAGIQRYGNALTTTKDSWDEVLDVNLVGAWYAAQATIPFLLENGSGAIVNISSVQALASQQNVMAYTVSKHGLIGLTRSIAMDYASKNIRANVLCPGTVDTPMLKWAASLDPDPDSVYKACEEMHPLGRIADPREIAEVATFLAHNSASFVTGSVWTADGGLLTQIGGVPKTE